MKKILLGVGVLCSFALLMTFSDKLAMQAACLEGDTSCSEEVDVSVTIQPGDVCIGTTGSFDFGTYTSSATAQTVSGAFTDDFWVEDLKGADTGYYTTLQLSGDLVSAEGNAISGSNVSVLSDGTVETLAGNDNARVVIDGSMVNNFVAIDDARTFIERYDAPNSGLVGMYGDKPQMQVVIPAYTPVGTYTATLVYTLYEGNDRPTGAADTSAYPDGALN